MPMPAVLGTIAQQGQAGGGGGGGGGGSGDPSIATSSSGNYDNAVVIGDYDASSLITSSTTIESGSNFSGGDASIGWEVSAANNFQSSSNRQLRIFGYIREGGSGTSNPEWELDALTVTANDGTLGTLSGSAGAAIVDSSGGSSLYNNFQDNTLATRGYTGIGGYIQVSAGGGRGGLTWGAAGDKITFDINATIDGDSCAEVEVEITWSS